MTVGVYFLILVPFSFYSNSCYFSDSLLNINPRFLVEAANCVRTYNCLGNREVMFHMAVGLRYLFQLMLSLSPLKGHKWRYNFSDTPSGVCHCSHGIEYTSHILFSCRSHVIHRAALVAVVNEILYKFRLTQLVNQSQSYIYGDPSLNDSDNKIIILSTIKYRKETRRFST